MAEDVPNPEGAIDVLSRQDVQSRILTIKDASDDLSASGVDAVVTHNGILLVGDAQASIAQSEARYRHLINQMGAYVVELLPSGDMVYINEAMMELSGVFSGGWRDFDLFRYLLVIQSPPPSGTLKLHFLQADELKDYRTGFLAKDGSSKVLSWNSAHVLDKNKQVVRLILLGLDVTQQVKAEQEIRIAAIAFESQEGMIVTDANGTILRVNKAFTEITGYQADETIGKNPRILQSGRQDAVFYVGMWETLARDGFWQGEIWNQHKSGEIYPEWLMITAVRAEDGHATQYVGAFIDSTLRKADASKIERLAFYDPLTQLANRRLMLDRLKQALVSTVRHHRQGALMLIDIDNFKSLNDTLGHDVGDKLLIEVARRLGLCVREADTVARFGGDEFVIILEYLDESALAVVQAEAVAIKILECLRQPYFLELHANLIASHQQNYFCTSSIGVTLFPNGDLSPDNLIKQADLAMYKAKAAGRNTIRFFDLEMQTAILLRMALEADLRQAIASQQFVLYYQIQVNASGAAIGAETLIRWQHPDRGVIQPGEFIHLAEETGLILQMGGWVLKAACLQLRQWADHPVMSSLVLAVNVSAHQFHSDDFVAQVIQVLAETGTNPVRLKLELTESLLIQNLEAVIIKMQALKKIGISFSLDDFGTGYSSLAYLKRLPFDQLKIDQSFVRDVLTDPNDAAIARTIVALGNSLGIEVIAEGVETEEHREFLALNGCLFFQGYLFGRPLPLIQFESLL